MLAYCCQNLRQDSEAPTQRIGKEVCPRKDFGKFCETPFKCLDCLKTRKHVLFGKES